MPVPIVKLGKEGALVWLEGRAVPVPPWDFPHLDSTGAGDAFLGGVSYGLSQGWDILHAVELGNYTGAKRSPPQDASPPGLAWRSTRPWGDGYDPSGKAAGVKANMIFWRFL